MKWLRGRNQMWRLAMTVSCAGVWLWGQGSRFSPLLSNMQGGCVSTEEVMSAPLAGRTEQRVGQLAHALPHYLHASYSLFTFHAVLAKQQGHWKWVWAPAAEQWHTEEAPGGAARSPGPTQPFPTTPSTAGRHSWHLPSLRPMNSALHSPGHLWHLLSHISSTYTCCVNWCLAFLLL